MIYHVLVKTSSTLDPLLETKVDKSFQYASTYLAALLYMQFTHTYDGLLISSMQLQMVEFFCGCICSKVLLLVHWQALCFFKSVSFWERGLPPETDLLPPVLDTIYANLYYFNLILSQTESLLCSPNYNFFFCHKTFT